MLSLSTVLLCTCNCSPPSSTHMYKARVSATTQSDPTICTCPDSMLLLVQSYCLYKAMPPYCSWKTYCVHATTALLPEKLYCVHTPLYAAWACTACHVYRERAQIPSHSNPDTQATLPRGAGETSFHRTKPHDPYFAHHLFCLFYLFIFFLG